MSAKKGRRAKVLTAPQLETRKGPSNDDADSPNLSAIERASFLEGLQQNYGNPLHSTAMEEDLNVLEEEGMNGGKAKTTVKQRGAAVKRKETERDGENEEKEEKKNRGKAGRKEIPLISKTTVKQRGAAAKRKETERDGENEEEEKIKNRGKVGRKEIPQTSKTTVKQRGAAMKRKETERDGDNKEEEEKKNEQEMNRGKAGRKEIPQTSKTTVKQRGTAAKRKETERDGDNKEEEEKRKRSRRSTGGTSAVRPVKNQQMKKGTKSKSGSGSGMSSAPESQEKSDSGSSTPQQSRKKVLSSEEEEEVDEDKSWCPSPKKAKVYSLGRTRKSSSDKSKSRKSSSGSASAEPEKADIDKRRRKRRGRHGGTQLEVVLDAFLEFCDQYRESVESDAVKQSIDSFSSNVKEQLMEKISSSRELKVLKRENAKVGSLIRTKTQRLLDAKHELMRAERQVWTLQKEKAELKVRLADLRRGQALLRDIRELNRQYLDYRHKHPKEKETYGSSSLPALLLEIKHMQAADHQWKGVNNPLKKRLKKSKTQK